MNAQGDLQSEINALHREAVRASNEWRGRCMNLFARGERIVTAALTAGGKTVKQNALLSQKLDLLAASGSNQAKLLKCLDEFRGLLDLRNTIVHCEARVLFDIDRRWMSEFEDFSGATRLRVSDTDGEVLRRKIQQAVDKLRSRLETNSRSSGRADMPFA